MRKILAALGLMVVLIGAALPMAGPAFAANPWSLTPGSGDTCNVIGDKLSGQSGTYTATNANSGNTRCWQDGTGPVG
jgi:hypothetical protein